MVCEVHPQKEDPNCTRITTGINRIYYPGNVGTPMDSLELVKLLINSVLSLQGAKFFTFDVKRFYLVTPLNCLEYACVRLTDIP